MPSCDDNKEIMKAGMPLASSLIRFCWLAPISPTNIDVHHLKFSLTLVRNVGPPITSVRCYASKKPTTLLIMARSPVSDF